MHDSNVGVRLRRPPRRHISEAMADLRGRVAARLGLGMAAASLAVVAVVLWHVLARRPPAEAPNYAVTTASDAAVDFAFTRLARPRPLPALRFAAADGRELTLADFRGRAVLLNLWATWCGPCRQEMPTLDRLQQRLGGPRFQVVALSIDRLGLAAVAPFYKKLRLDALAVYLDPSGQSAAALDVPGLPTSLLIDAEGREIARKIGPAAWDRPAIVQKIERWLKTPH
jgi:thiol-disulfide isomerase/thioredoxin